MIIKGNKPVIVFLSLILGITSSLFAYDIVVPNEDGINICYSWTSDNKTSLSVSKVEFDSSKVESGILHIPANVTYQERVCPVVSIGRWAISHCDGLNSVDMPNSILSIAEYAFYDCSDLTNVFIPNSVKSISEFAFHDCKNLVSVTMSNSVNSIGSWAFGGCSKLASITIPESVSYIGEYAFQYNTSLTRVEIYCEKIGNWFNGLPIKEVVIGDKVKTIGETAFIGCRSINNITIPASVTNIGERAFEECTGLTNVTIPNNVKVIGRLAFRNCYNLEKIVINGSPKIKEDAFHFEYEKYAWLDTIVLRSQTPPTMYRGKTYACSSGYPFTDHTFEKVVLLIPEGSYDAYAASETWSHFKNICTYSDNEDESVFENDSIYYTLQEDGAYVAARSMRGRKDYSGDGPLTPRDPASGGQQPRIPTRTETQETATDSLDYTLYRGNIVIPESVSVFDTAYTVTGINDYAFQGCYELESVSIPNSVKKIGYAGFAECTDLTEITIPAGVELIDKYAFANCSNLKRIVIEGNPEIDETAFIGCGTDIEVIYTVVETHKAVDTSSDTDGAIHYGIDGRRIQADTPGLHLIKRKDGSVVKALVR